MTAETDYQWLFRKAPVMATSISEEGRFLDVNDLFLDRLGYTREEMLGRHPTDFMTEASARRIVEEFRPALRRIGRLDNKPVSFVGKSGEVVDCTTNAIVEHDRSGAYLSTIALYVEAGDETRADFRYRTLYRSMPAMLHTLDAEGRILTVTDHWLRKLGYEREEVVGRTVTDFYSEADRARFESDAALREVISRGDFNNVERQMVTKSGNTLDIVMSAISHRDHRGDVDRLLIASKDVTERNRAERELRRTLAENARLREELELERDYLREEVGVAMNFGRIIGTSEALRKMLKRVEAVADTPASVLVLGESGTGKELVAHAIHSKSPRASGPLVKVNCASIPKELFESEFFGHVKGAFTGAHRDRVGRFQLADGGTLFLDEVGEIPLELQGKLLRVLQEGEFERVGDDVTRSVDIRIVAATNRNLEAEIVAGRFREDLFYRLSVFPVEVPPLRERGEDVVQLARHFLDQTVKDFGREPLALTQTHAKALRAYPWPGNVRELKNVIERAVILSPGSQLRLELGTPPATGAAARAALPDDADILDEQAMREFTRTNIVRALEASNWRVSGKGGAADLLGVRPTTLADRIKSYQIARPERR
ncbi:MAG: sigma 54-interacting transcriptional regulator [Woeseiaceae bacterium]|jgi:PAS domain S-box-containing protein|nr:sigma 54-interacting transcriptional regulator [Woeseiaceae bacterium]